MPILCHRHRTGPLSPDHNHTADDEFSATTMDTESAAVALVCYQQKVPFISRLQDLDSAMRSEIVEAIAMSSQIWSRDVWRRRFKAALPPTVSLIIPSPF
ncbi:unnamed protein product [Linum trigynum]|uniref:Uncharacterized protein n=1 Tax=Linum trigynum TaxID=586398 RepID=A0AAV2E6P4_9ROSI